MVGVSLVANLIHSGSVEDKRAKLLFPNVLAGIEARRLCIGTGSLQDIEDDDVRIMGVKAAFGLVEPDNNALAAGQFFGKFFPKYLHAVRHVIDKQDSHRHNGYRMLGLQRDIEHKCGTTQPSRLDQGYLPAVIRYKLGSYG